MLFSNTGAGYEDYTPKAGAFVYDWNAAGYVIDDGSPLLCYGAEAVKQFVLQALATKRGQYPIYPETFGTTLHELMGKKLPRGYALPELQREIEESCSFCPEIDTVDDFKADGGKISFRVKLKAGTVLEMLFDTAEYRLNVLGVDYLD